MKGECGGMVRFGHCRFRGTDPALQALEFVVTYGNLDDNHKVLLNKTFPITTLDRLLQPKKCVSLLGSM